MAEHPAREQDKLLIRNSLQATRRCRQCYGRGWVASTRVEVQSRARSVSWSTHDILVAILGRNRTSVPPVGMFQPATSGPMGGHAFPEGHQPGLPGQVKGCRQRRLCRHCICIFAKTTRHFRNAIADRHPTGIGRITAPTRRTSHVVTEWFYYSSVTRFRKTVVFGTHRTVGLCLAESTRWGRYFCRGFRNHKASLRVSAWLVANRTSSSF